LEQLVEESNVNKNPVIAIEVWSLAHCPRCVEAKTSLRAAGVEVVERDLEAVRNADIRDIDVLAQVSMQNDAAPVLRVVREGGGRCDEFIEPDALGDWLAKHHGGT
jgi:glutaredoxin